MQVTWSWTREDGVEDRGDVKDVGDVDDVCRVDEA